MRAGGAPLDAIKAPSPFARAHPSASDDVLLLRSNVVIIDDEIYVLPRGHARAEAIQCRPRASFAFFMFRKAVGTHAPPADVHFVRCTFAA